MSSHTWTQDALQSELRPLQVPAWRLVEAPHVVSTLSLVDNLDEQNLLEDILEETKPPVPAECRHLDYLLSTPFRYRPYPYGSRFRKAGLTPGVWYGAEQPETAVCGPPPCTRPPDAARPCRRYHLTNALFAFRICVLDFIRIIGSPALWVR